MDSHHENHTVTTPYVNRVIRSCSMTIVSLLIIFGNAFCLLILRRANNIGMRDTTKIFLISLTFADLSLGIFGAIPVTVTAILGYFPGGVRNPVCPFHAMITYFLWLISCLSLLAVTIERYISVVYPLRYPLIVTVRRSKLGVFLLWTFICTFYILGVPLTYLVLPPSATDSTLDPDYLMCLPTPSERAETASVQGFFWILVTCGFIPVLNVVFMYTRMLYIARQRIAKTLVERGGEIAVTIAKRQAASERRATVTFFIITTASIIAWFPFTVVSFQEYILLRIVEPYWKFLSMLFLFSGSWFNFVIYYIRNKNFRKTAKHVLSSVIY